MSPQEFEAVLAKLRDGQYTDADQRVMLSRLQSAIEAPGKPVQLCPSTTLCDVCDVYGDGECLVDDPDFDPQEI